MQKIQWRSRFHISHHKGVSCRYAILISELRWLSFLFIYSLTLLLANPSLAAAKAEQTFQDSLASLGYEDVELSGCIVQFKRNLVPSAKNGFTYHYIRIINLEYIADFLLRDIQEVSIGDTNFFGFETRLGLNYPLRPLDLRQFETWVNQTYPASNWPNVRTSSQQTNLPEIERQLHEKIPYLDKLNRWVFKTKFGENTQIDSFFQITAKDRRPLEHFLTALTDYAASYECNIED